MKLIPTAIDDVLILEPTVFGDERGFFMETWREEWFQQAGLDYRFVQENYSRSRRGTLRGLHYQVARHAQGKLVRAVAGEIYDVAVDLRRNSPTFGQWVGVSLSAENRLALWVPPGFAHGFYVTSDSADMSYKCTDYYAPEHERSLRWNDPDLAIDWPLVGGEVTISDKDANAPLFAAAQNRDGGNKF